MGQSKENTLQEELASKWVDKSITPAQEKQFEDWYNQEQNQPLIIATDFAETYELHKNRIYDKVIDEIGIAVLPSNQRLWRPLIATAAVIGMTLAVYFYFQANRHYDLDKLADAYHTGSNVAVLINENGGEQLLKDSVLNLQRHDDETSASIASYKIVTPKGGQYKVVLEDGTKVWLSADTKLVYPARFNKSDRTVTLYGEAFFEVTPDSQRPFHVKLSTRYSQQDLTVLGTKFNLIGYADDEEIMTTVYEGTVRVTSGKSKITLKAGEELINRNGKLFNEVFKAKEALDKYKGHSNCFILNGDIFSCMRKISRRYNVSIVYDGVVKGAKIYGCINKKAKLEEVLEILGMMGQYHFDVDKNKVFISTNADY